MKTYTDKEGVRHIITRTMRHATIPSFVHATTSDGKTLAVHVNDIRQEPDLPAIDGLRIPTAEEIVESHHALVSERFKRLMTYNPNEAGPDGLALIGIAHVLDRMDKLMLPQDVFQDVVDFHKKFGMDYSKRPRSLPLPLEKDREEMLCEEYQEYLQACLENNLEEQFDGLVDLIYVALGTIRMHGWNFREGWRRVHAANMAKESAGLGNNLKANVVKPEGWKAPTFKDLV